MPLFSPGTVYIYCIFQNGCIMHSVRFLLKSQYLKQCQMSCIVLRCKSALAVHFQLKKSSSSQRILDVVAVNAVFIVSLRKVVLNPFSQ